MKTLSELNNNTISILNFKLIDVLWIYFLKDRKDTFIWGKQTPKYCQVNGHHVSNLFHMVKKNIMMRERTRTKQTD